MAEVKIRNATVKGTDFVSLDLMKQHLRVENSEEDTLIKAYMDSAAQYIESVSGRVFTYSNSTPQARVFVDANEREAFVRRINNLSLVTASYKDKDGVKHVLPEDNYALMTDTYPAVIRIKKEPSDLMKEDPEGAYMFLLSGGEAASDAPAQFKMAMFLLVSHYYTNREAEYVGGISTELKEGVKRLMNTVKRF